MNKLYNVQTKSNIPTELQNTPIGLLLEYHNLKRPYDTYTTPQLLIGMCMDNRKHLKIPDNFAFILRTGGANLSYSEFRVSYAIAVGGVKYIALIGHTKCGMSNLRERKDLFVEGLMERAGWEREQATKHFDQYVDIHEIGNEVDFVVKEKKRLKKLYPKIEVASFIYNIDDNLLYKISESG